MALLLSCQDLAKTFTDRPLFTGITLGLYEQERIGLIGPNGSGKSTFLKILAGVETADVGDITRRRDLRLGFVPQQDSFAPDATPLTVLLEALTTRGDAQLDETTRHNQAAKTLTRIGFTDLNVQASTLSGGWRKRLAIARELVLEPQLLLLDEPTNHLDIEGILWLEKLLEKSTFACLVVSHDRYFLENMTTRIIEINRTYRDGFFSVEGSYSDFLERREEILAAQASEQESLANRVRQEIAWLRRGPKAQRRKSKFRQGDAAKAIDDLAALKSRNSAFAAKVDIEFSATQRKTNKLLVAHNLSKTLGDKALFSKLDLILTPGMRLGLLGQNGSGKTTLLKILNGDLQPDSGNVKRAADLRVVYFDQSRQSVSKDQTLRLALAGGPHEQVIYQGRPMHVSAWAKRFLFRYEQLDLPVSALSGGEQARILVARLMLQPADVLILDEPTNDLDIPSLEVLEESLEEFPGAIILVTHDRYMLERMSTELIALHGGEQIGRYTDFEQWERGVENLKNVRKEEARQVQAVTEVKAQPSGGKKKLTYAEQLELAGMEDKIMAAEEVVTRRHQEMDGAVGGDARKLEEICQKLHEAQEAVAKLYRRWEELETKGA